MNPNLNATLSAIRALLVAIGGLLAAHGLQDSGVYQWVELGSSAVMIIGPAVWGVYEAIANWHKAAAVGVQAGVNMTVAGKALAADGTTVVTHNDGTTPPLAVTVATATQIVKDFAPNAPPAAV